MSKRILQNSAEVEWLDKLVGVEAIIEGDDFFRETEQMFQQGSSPPFTLLVYDNLLAFGTYFRNSNLWVLWYPYSQEMLKDRIDIALSFYKQPLRAVDKTTNGELISRLEPRINLPWVSYHPTTGIIQEKNENCFAKKLFDSQSIVTEELCSLYVDERKVHAVRMRIHHEQVTNRDRGTVVSGVKCQFAGHNEYDGSIDDIEAMLRKAEPSLMILRQPLQYCHDGPDQRPWSCLARIFELAYTKRNGTELGFSPPNTPRNRSS